MSKAPKRPASEILPIAQSLVKMLAPHCEKIELAGSLRRQSKEVADIELVAIPKIEAVEIPVPGDLFGEKKSAQANRLWEALDKLLDGKYIRAGEKYRAFVCPGQAINVDLFTADQGNWGLIYLIRTGSAEFSQYVVTALGKNYRPSFEGWVRLAPENGPRFWGDDEKRTMPKLPTPTEEAVFEYAKLQYREPWQRT